MALSLKDSIQALQNRQLSSVELTRICLDNNEKNQQLNAFISHDPEFALAEAQKADEKLKSGHAPLLTGIPVAHKDVFCTHHFPTTCASKMLQNFYSPYQATVVNRLFDAGAITLGKTNMDEFAMGSANENSHFGSVPNPWNMTRVAGGSSGGSAAAVAAELCVFATGSDTGGSIRQPAAFCGVSGLKPTYGLLSRFGMVAYASSLDQAGALAQSAEDLALILQAMAGFDPNDSTSVQKPSENYLQHLNRPVKGLKIGLPGCFFQSGTSETIQKALIDSIKILESLGAEMVELDFKLHDSWIPCYYMIACAEASSNLSRFDGLRFGHQSREHASLKRMITASRSEGLGAEVQRRILTGTFVLSSGYYDAYYLKALKVRRLIQNEWLDNFKKVDVILGPVTPITAFYAGHASASSAEIYLSDIFTVAANLAGLPAMSVPAGFDENNLPIGLQLTAPHFEEAKLLNIAHQFQQATHWHLQRPENSTV